MFHVPVGCPGFSLIHSFIHWFMFHGLCSPHGLCFVFGGDFLKLMDYVSFKEFCSSYCDFKLRFFLQFSEDVSFLEDLMSCISNSVYYNVLHCKIVKGMSFVDVSVFLNYSYRYTLLLYDKALKELYSIYLSTSNT